MIKEIYLKRIEGTEQERLTGKLVDRWAGRSSDERLRAESSTFLLVTLTYAFTYYHIIIKSLSLFLSYPHYNQADNAGRTYQQSISHCLS